MDLENEWADFFENPDTNEIQNESSDINRDAGVDIPKPTSIYISTKTKISYLNQDIDLFDVFWKIKMIQYYEDKEGIIKKQMKFNSLTRDAYNNTLEYIEKEKPNNYVEETLIQHVDTQSGDKIKFKDIRKVSIGISKKDIMSYRSKPKSAFYNCFVVLVRLKINDIFKEIHIKIFNTGKVEIPGIQNDETFNKAIEFVKCLMVSFYPGIDFVENRIETVLINSNFSCGYLINRDRLFTKLKNKYKINASYDPCSYPGIQCKYKVVLDNITYEISFMIFRTGSILIVGKCSDEVLYNVYDFLKQLLHDEYFEIKQPGEMVINDKNKKKKIRKKKITIST